MQISSSASALNNAKHTSAIKPLFTEKLSKDEVAEIRAELKQNSQIISFNSASVQGQLNGNKDSFKQDYQDFQTFLSDVGYSGKPIAELSQEEATELVSEDGVFGISQTSERIANFVINGAGGDESMMRAGREGMIAGFKEAEAMWGGKLPDISQETMAKSIELVDKAMYDLGFSIINKEA
ncbi:MAG: hypothetical protein L3J19_00970 [Sulfurimonas sp.]|nr:hypothetical protein [Sulfurimonas sp.]